MKLLLMTMLSSLLLNITAFADDAVKDIIETPRYQGAIETIDFITRIVDNGFVMFVSFVAFFIISAAVLRNALAGAYCVFPKFWDKVHVEHEKVMSTTFGSIPKMKIGGASMGSITGFILGLLPDIKVLTDFEQEDGASVDYKRYFMRALPQAVCAVFVGVFIYNGHYRDVMALTSNFGSEIITNFIASADPEAFLTRMVGFSGKPEASTDAATSGTDLIVNKATWSVYNKVISHYTDLARDKQTKQTLIAAIEKQMKINVEDHCQKYADTQNWDITVDSSLHLDGTILNTVISEDGNEATIVLPALFFSDLGIESTIDTDKNYCVQTVLRFSRHLTDGSSQKKVTDFVLTIPNQFTNSTITFPTTTDGKLYLGGATAKGSWKGNSGEGTIIINQSKNLLSFKEGKLPQLDEVVNVTGLTYVSHGVQHVIKKIVISSSATGFELKSADFGLDIEVGEKVVLTGTGLPQESSESED